MFSFAYLLSLLGVAAAASDKIFFPPFTGQYHVGKTQHILDHTTTNDPLSPGNRGTGTFIVLTVLYPTENAPTEKTSTKYIDDRLAHAIEQGWNLTGGSLERLWTPIQWQPPPIDAQELPTLLFSPGLGVPCDTQMVITAEMASRGYVVLCVDHPGEAPFLKTPGTETGTWGPPIDYPWDDFDEDTRIHEIRKSDYDAVLAAFPDLVKQYKAPFNTTAFIHFGFSLGGSIGPYLVSKHKNVLGGVNYDGTFFDVANNHIYDVKKPFMIWGDDQHGRDQTFPPFEDAQSSWWIELKVLGTHHLNFMDTKWWVELTHFNDTYPLAGPIGAARFRDIQVGFTEAFFNYVLGKGAGVLNQPLPSSKWPEVSVTNRSRIH